VPRARKRARLEDGLKCQRRPLGIGALLIDRESKIGRGMLLTLGGLVKWQGYGLTAMVLTDDAC